MKITFESEDHQKTIEIKGKRNEVMYMLYKYSAILNINCDEYDEIKSRLDNICNPANSSLKELSIKEQLKYYIELNVCYSTDKDRMFELIDML